MNPRFELDAEGVGQIIFGDPLRAHNVLTEEVLLDLEQAVAQAHDAAGEGRLRVLLIASAKPGSFIAGADVDAITAIAAAGDRKRGVEISRRIQAMFGRIAEMPVPTIAAIRGICLGGGTELALACHYRVSDDGDRTRIGLPEVQLGILPGWGGTTRLPRLVGLRAALDLLLTGKPARVSKAKRIGLVDQVFPRHQFRERCLDFARDVADGHGQGRDARATSGRRERRARVGSGRPRVRRGVVARLLDGTAPGRWLVLRMAGRRVLKLTGGRYVAPLRILSVVRRGLRGGPAAGLQAEAEAIGNLIASPVCRHLLGLFGWREAARKGPWSDGGRDAGVDRVAVVGAGQLGAGIAQLAAYNDLPVRMKDVRHEAVAGGLAYARSVFDGAVKRRKLRRRDAMTKMAMISGGLDYSGVALAGLVVEAVVERMDVKQAVLREVEAAVRAEAVIVTNTSSLSIDEMASVLERPGRFAGMHFFHPVHRMPLVEVVAGERTGADTIETIAALAVRLGKVPVITRDGPGFLVNRIIGPGLNEAGHLLDEGWDAAALDHVWTRFGMPMGPCRLIDTIGMEVAYHAGQALAAAFGDRLAPARSLTSLATSNRPGQKGGRGFYLYEGAKPKGIDPSVYADMGVSSPRSDLDPAGARDRTILAMVNEAARVLEDGIVPGAADVDLGMIMGAGFPPFRGGLLKYADDRGLHEIFATLSALHDAHGNRFEPSALLTQLAEGGETFHRAFPPADGARTERE
ncbi:MAG: 3-hydroxyacyl-CoA dehydrogenase NAD-binding domain-containing protein [Gemmatimonadota bacterium]|nr:3-hydroxyacyl-CoA dehydrogenase NAD-binding domain-containing protein [Gemmatimonadota bacterium]